MAEPELRADILVVDDTPANLRLLSELLGERGYRVRPVTSGEQALRAVEAEVPDLVLLDIRMPGLDGYATCRRLRADPRFRGVPVIFLSALHEVVDKVEAFAVGGVDFIAKPFHVEEVLARIGTHLELRRLQRDLERARARSDALLDRLLPPEVAARLRAGEVCPGRAYVGVSILHASIVGFAEIARRVSPSALFERLGALYGELDRLARAAGASVIQAHGGSYVVVRGLSERPDEVAGDALAELALAMIAAVGSPSLAGDEPLALRIGLHCGDVVGGLLGEEAPRYCILGAAMTVAAELAAAAVPQKIQLSDAFRQRLGPGRFAVQERGLMTLRGAGALRTHFLQGLAG